MPVRYIKIDVDEDVLEYLKKHKGTKSWFEFLIVPTVNRLKKKKTPA